MRDMSILGNKTRCVNKESIDFLNNCIKEVCIEGDNLFKYRKIIEKRFPDDTELLIQLEELVNIILEQKHKSKFTKTSVHNIKYLAKEVYIMEDTIDEIVAISDTPKMGSRLFVCLRNGKFGLIDVAGNIVIDPIYDSIDSGFREGLAAVCHNGKEGYMDERGNIVIEPRFDVAGQFSNGVAVVKSKNVYCLINKEGEAISKELPYDEVHYCYDGLCRIKQGDKYGYINTEGDVIIKPKYFEATDFSEGRAQVMVGDENNERWGFIDKMGNVVFERSGLLNKWHSEFKEGILVDDKVFVKRIKVREGFFRTKEYKSQERKYGFIDQNGKCLIEHVYDEAYSFSNGLARVGIKGKIGFINKSGEMLIDPKYLSAHDFSCGLAVAEMDGKWGYIDELGNLKITLTCDNAEDFTKDGLAAFRQNGKVGFIDKSGSVVIPPQFHCAIEGFWDGLCRVVFDEDYTKYGYINLSGETVYIDS